MTETFSKTERPVYRIAIFLHGGVAPPGSKFRIPAITDLVGYLSEEFDISVYTTVKPDGLREPFSCGRASVRYIGSAPHAGLPATVIRFLKDCRRDHAQYPYHLVHGFWAFPGGLAAVSAGRMLAVPTIVSFMGGEAACLPSIHYGHMRATPFRPLTMWIARSADRLTLLSRYQHEGLRRFGFSRTDGVDIIPLGADPAAFDPPVPRAYGPPFNLLHIAHLNRVKDQTTLLRAFARMNETVPCTLRIAGEDTLNGSMRQLARRLGVSDRVMFLGWVPHAEIPRLLKWAHVLLHSSLYEGEGVVFAEAALSETPICGTRVGLLSDLGESVGAVAETADPERLANEALSLLLDRPRRERCVANAAAWARDHTAPWSAARYVDLYRNLLGGEPAPAIQGQVVEQDVPHGR